MTFLEYVRHLVFRGFHVFPLHINSKLPAIKDFPRQASNDPVAVGKWWLDPVLEIEQPFNIGISTSKYRDDSYLIVVDVDIKNGKKGDEELLALELEGYELPQTYTQFTPTGGKHLVYYCDRPVKQGVQVFGSTGLDIRAKGGYIVGAGSVIDGEKYKGNSLSVAEAPKWLVEKCGQAAIKEEIKVNLQDVDKDRAEERAIFYLENEAPLSIKGQGGDQTAYKVAARVKDFGVDPPACLRLMLDHWNDRCPPGWSPERLKEKVDHAYRYGIEPVGVAAPEVEFTPVEEGEKDDPQLREINKNYALVYMEGNHFILHETIDEKGKPKLVFLTETTFKRRFSPYLLRNEGKRRPLSYADSWLDWIGRREYKGVCFAPEKEPKHNYYNLWRGFAVKETPYEQATNEAKRGFNMFMEHVEKNLCRGDKLLSHWVIGYFAHLIQKPYERPLTTLVFRGEKGVGKNAMVDRVGKLLGHRHYLVAHDGRYLTSNFNGHLDSCLMLVLDEAFWSGDKAAEGKLKGITTAPEIIIERKGKEPYMVDNLVRLVVIGNESWLVPASTDERRYAVLDVGTGRRQDTKFFSEMRVLMDDKGGCEILLHYLKNFSLADIDVNKAPSTEALLEQKVSSLDHFYQWWHDCLSEGRIIGLDFSSEWPAEVSKEQFRNALLKYCKDRQIRSRIPNDSAIGKNLKRCVKTLTTNKKREGTETYGVYRFPDLKTCRVEWENFIGQKSEWTD